MSVQLYFGPGACSFVPHVLLESAGADYEARLVKLHKGEQHEAAFRAINPRGQVPVLVDGGQTITQILAIVGYLADRFPACHFLPAEPLARARVLETLSWMNNTAHPTFTQVFMPHKFSDQEPAQAALRAHALGQFRAIQAELDALARRAAPWLAGEHFGPLDAYALTLWRWGCMVGIDPAGAPAMTAHAERVAQLPAVARVLERERVPLHLYKPG